MYLLTMQLSVHSWRSVVITTANSLLHRCCDQNVLLRSKRSRMLSKKAGKVVHQKASKGAKTRMMHALLCMTIPDGVGHLRQAEERMVDFHTQARDPCSRTTICNCMPAINERVVRLLTVFQGPQGHQKLLQVGR